MQDHRIVRESLGFGGRCPPAAGVRFESAKQRRKLRAGRAYERLQGFPKIADGVLAKASLPALFDGRYQLMVRVLGMSSIGSQNEYFHPASG